LVLRALSDSDYQDREFGEEAMKPGWNILIAALCGAVLGAVSVHSLQAQGKRLAYYVAEVDLTGDAASYEKDYVPKVRASIEKSGGKTLVAAQKPTVLEGDPPKPRIAIVAFDSMDELLAWWNSDQYKQDRKISDKYATVKSYAVEGVTD
jgi:uncharacterized protein (DUF1330 family)